MLWTAKIDKLFQVDQVDILPIRSNVSKIDTAAYRLGIRLPLIVRNA